MKNKLKETNNTKKCADVEASSACIVSCKWTRAFDGHFNISCPSGKRANGDFHTDSTILITKWEFTYCPYCGNVIEICS